MKITEFKVPIEGTHLRLQSLQQEIIHIIQEIIDSGKYLSSIRVAELEKSLETTWGRNAVATTSGSSALQLAQLAAGVRAGDEVIVPALTFVSTAYAVSAIGAIPVFVDIEPYTFTIDPDAVSAAITDKTTAMIPVHLYGQMADMQALMALASKYKLKIIEDVAQAHGAKYNGQYAGTIGDFGCFSMYVGKNMGGLEDGGVILVKNSNLIPKLYRLRDLGRMPSDRYFHSEFGFRARMGELTAAVINLELQLLESWNYRRQQIAKKYNQAFSNLNLKIPHQAPNRTHVYYKYTIVANSSEQRIQLEESLASQGIQTERIYPRLVPEQPVYLSSLSCRTEAIDISKNIVERLLCLPIYPEMKNSEVDAVIEAMHFVNNQVLATV